MSAAGAMRARVKVQSPSRIADEIGGAAISWADEGEAWARIEAEGAGESVDFDTSVARSRYGVTINRREDVRVGWRIAWGVRRLRVVGVADDGAPRLRLSCEEETL